MNMDDTEFTGEFEDLPKTVEEFKRLGELINAKTNVIVLAHAMLSLKWAVGVIKYIILATPKMSKENQHVFDECLEMAEVHLAAAEVQHDLNMSM